MSHVVWNVDGQRGDLGLHRLHRGLRGFALGLLPAGQRRERDLDVGAGEAEGAPAAGERRVITRLPRPPRRKSSILSENSAFCEVTKGQQKGSLPSV